jgi:hypothetical protein
MGREAIIYRTGDREGLKSGPDAVVKRKFGVVVTNLMPNAYMELYTVNVHAFLARV